LDLEEALSLSSILNQKNKERQLISQSLDDNVDLIERSAPASPAIRNELHTVMNEVVDTVEYYVEQERNHHKRKRQNYKHQQRDQSTSHLDNEHPSTTDSDHHHQDDNQDASAAANNVSSTMESHTYDDDDEHIDTDRDEDDGEDAHSDIHLLNNGINHNNLVSTDQQDQSIDEEDVTARLKELAEHLSLMDGDDTTPLSENDIDAQFADEIDDWEDDDDLGYAIIPAIPGSDDIYDYINDEEDYPDQERDNDSDEDDEVTDDEDEDDDGDDEDPDQGSDARAKVFELYPNHFSAQKQQINNHISNDEYMLDDDDEEGENDLDDNENDEQDEDILEVSADSSRTKEAWTEADQHDDKHAVPSGEKAPHYDSNTSAENGSDAKTTQQNSSALSVSQSSSLIEPDEINAPEDAEQQAVVLTNNFTTEEAPQKEGEDERPVTPRKNAANLELQDDDEQDVSQEDTDAESHNEDESSKLQDDEEIEDDDEEVLNDDDDEQEDNFPDHENSFASSLNQSRRSAEEARMPQFETLYLPVVHERNKTGFEEHKDFPITINSIIAGRYQILEYLGSAAFSRAIQCYDLHTKELVCIKIIKNNKDYFDQSLDEIKLLRYINSRGDPDEHHVVRLYEFFYYKEHLFLVCELLRDNLYEYSKFNRENEEELYFTIPRLQKISRQLLKGLHYIHNLQLIHCDLKPENILIKSYSRCEVKIIDFGSSCFVYDHLCSYVQSRTYRAPEVIFGLPYTEKIDVWSLGCILAELHTGKVLFSNTSIQTMIARIIAICGDIPDKMIHEGRYTRKFFSKQYVLYEKEKRTGRINFLIPKKTSLKARLHTDDDLFVDFIRQCLIIDPDQRPSIEQCMEHPFITSNRYRITT